MRQIPQQVMSSSNYLTCRFVFGTWIAIILASKEDSEMILLCLLVYPKKIIYLVVTFVLVGRIVSPNRRFCLTVVVPQLDGLTYC